MTTWSQKLLLLSLATALLAGGDAYAQTNERTLVIVDTVDFTAEKQTAVRDSALQYLKERGIPVVVALADTPSGSDLGACIRREPACVRRLFAGRAIDRVLLFSLRSTMAESVGGGDLSITGRVFAVQSGELLAVDERVCSESCSQEDVFVRLIHELTDDLAGVDVPSAPTPEVAVNQRPPGRAVVPTGRDTVEVGRPYRLLKFVSLGVGISAIATGATLIAIDGPRISNGEREPNANATMTPGIAAVGVGTAFVAAGVAMWVADSRDRRNVHAVAAPSAHGWVLAVGGSF